MSKHTSSTQPMAKDRQRNDLDGGGNLSEAALAEFARSFLSVSIDQVTLIQRLVQQDRPRGRLTPRKSATPTSG